jgi:ATP-dependent DNA helicase RecG
MFFTRIQYKEKHMTYVDSIRELLEAKEGEHTQFKEAKNRFDFGEAAKCCCALANNGGGKLVFGISDKRPRRVVGSNAFEQPERTRMGLIEKLKISIDFRLFSHEGKRILVFDVKSRPIGLPVQYDGVAWIYEGDVLKPMPEDMRRKIYDEVGVDFSGMICAGATVEDLDETAIENFRTKWIEKKGKKQLAALSKEQLLHDCGAITDEGITYAALILFGKNSSIIRYLPQAEIIFEYRSSEASGPANQREEFKTGFFACYDQIWELINLRNDKQHYQEGFFVFDIATFNERVVREAILNAVSHRSYQFGGSIFIRQYRDRLIVESPGGLPFGITLDNILDRQLPRNRRIAEILSLCGMVERSGQGMNLMFELSVQEAKPLPDFTGTDDFFVSVTLNGLILDKEMLSVIRRISEKDPEMLSTEDFLAINALYHSQPLDRKMQERLPRLTDMGIVEHIGRKKYVLARSLYAATGKSGVYTRRVGLDRDTNKELLMKHIRKNNAIGTPFKELQQVLPGLSRGQIQVLMRELRADGKIICIGKTSAARWFMNK